MNDLSCPVHQDLHVHKDHHDQHDHHDRGDHDDNGDHVEVGGYMRKLEVVHKEVGGCTQGSWRLSHLIPPRKLEVISSHTTKEVGGYITLASELIIISHSHSQV